MVGIELKEIYLPLHYYNPAYIVTLLSTHPLLGVEAGRKDNVPP